MLNELRVLANHKVQLKDEAKAAEIFTLDDSWRRPGIHGALANVLDGDKGTASDSEPKTRGVALGHVFTLTWA